ncbi:ABC transporter permease [Catenulispora subtropica]|uniref:Transport permease protein n=1 Tax=Catenulispora subtropica TaxID=450798 RepID=A0ABP5DQJ6_9ACTN
MKVLRDIWLIFQRNILLMWRSPLWVVLGVSQPVVYLLLFAPLLKPALAPMGAHSQADAYRIYVPGMLVALALAGGLYVGFDLLRDLAAGIVERARVTPVSRVALLLGRSLRDVVVLVIQAVIIVVLSLIFGLTVAIPNLLIGYGILALISLTSSSFSYGVALKIKNPAVMGQLINNIAQPLMLLSGTLLPIALAPLWLRDAANGNPFNWAVTGMRSLFTGHPDDSSVWKAAVMLAGLALVTIAWSGRKFARSVR